MVKKRIQLKKIQKRIKNKIDSSVRGFRRKVKDVRNNKGEIKPKLDVILVSVDYNDYLDKSLYHNTKIFKNITIITHPDDAQCVNICNKYGVNYLLSDDISKNKTINKSLGLNKILESLENPDWVLIIDADIIINKEIDINHLNKEYLYTSGRYICDDMKNYTKWVSGEVNISHIGKLEADRGIGFFQLFNYRMKKRYPDSNYGR